MCARTAPTRACCHVRVNCSGGCDVALAAATDGKTKSCDITMHVHILTSTSLNSNVERRVKETETAESPIYRAQTTIMPTLNQTRKTPVWRFTLTEHRGDLLRQELVLSSISCRAADSLGRLNDQDN